MSLAAVVMLSGVLAVEGWAPTVHWLQSIDRGDLALEAALLEAQDAHASRVEQTDLVAHLAGVLDTYPSGNATRLRAELELRSRLATLPWLLQQEARVALLAGGREDALHAAHGDRNALLAGSVRTAASIRKDLSNALSQATSHTQRRRLEALLRRTALLEGSLLVDLGRSDAQVLALLHTAILGSPDADANSVQSMPSGVLSQLDAAWAAEALVRLELRRGNVAAATHWVERLLSVDSPVLERTSRNVLVELLNALPVAVAQVHLQDWSEGLTDAAALAVLGAMVEHDAVLLGQLAGVSDVRHTLARAQRPLPASNSAAVAMAAFDRALESRAPWFMVRARLLEVLPDADQRSATRLALGRACLECGLPDEALAVLLAMPDDGWKAQADALALIAATRRDEQGAASLPLALLERMVERGSMGPGWSDACVRLAAHSMTTAKRADALLQGIDTAGAAAVREDRAWAAWQAAVVDTAQRSASAAAVVEAAAWRLPNAAAAGRLMAALPEAQLPQARRGMLLERALQAIELEYGSAAEASQRAHWLLSSGAASQALLVLREAWAAGQSSEALDSVALALLSHYEPLGSSMTEVAGRLLQKSPLSLTVGETTDAVHRSMLSGWAWHVLADPTLDVAVLRHIAALQVLSQSGQVQLARRASRVQAWSLAADAWARAAAFGGPQAANARVEQARMLAFVDPAAAIELAAQLRVLLAGTPEGDAAEALWQQLKNGAAP